MLIKSRKSWHLGEGEVTPESLYLRRRDFMKLGGAAAMAAYLPAMAKAALEPLRDAIAAAPTTRNLHEDLNSFEDITSYNNYYELGTSKSDPSRNADALNTDLWSISVEGECDNPGTYAVEDLVQADLLEERIYRMRCVEAWSMVIPWTGVPLSSMLEKLKPNSNAKYVAFETIYNPDNPLPGQRFPVLDWPYREGLRMDEAMHPLTLMAVGLYGKPMPNQNGAPIRLVVPWKYGFKGIKSIVKIRFTSEQPQTSWNLSAPHEYGFYSNVNPNVNHPRWSQATERRIGEFFRRDTLMFNGYGDEVAHLYEGMDLRENY
mgnify:CR=1 FL=1